MRGEIAGIATALGAAGAASEQAVGSVTQIVLGVLGGGLLTVVISHFLARRKDGVEISASAIKIVRESLDAIAEIRAEVAVKLADVQAALTEAQTQIGKLEQQIVDGEGERDRLIALLAEARVDEQALRAQVFDLQTRVAEMSRELARRPGRAGPAGADGRAGAAGADGRAGAAGADGRAGPAGERGPAAA